MFLKCLSYSKHIRSFIYPESLTLTIVYYVAIYSLPYKISIEDTVAPAAKMASIYSR